MSEVGLKRMLSRIAQDPANKVLADRYVSLVREIKDEEKKEKYILSLAKVLVEADPPEAMHYAFMVFKFNKASTQSLLLVARCLRLMGRTKKADVIEAEIKKLRNTAGEIDLSRLVNTEDPKKTIPLSNIDPAKTTKLPPPPQIPINKDSVFDLSKVEDSVAKLADYSTEADHGVVADLFDFYWRQGMIDEAKRLLDRSKKYAESTPWWQARHHILQTYERSEKKKLAETPHTTVAKLPDIEEAKPAFQSLPVSKIHNPEQIQVELPSEIDQWSSYIRELINSDRPRRALHEINKKMLADKVTIDWARAAWHCLQVLWPKLNIPSFHWEESLGAGDLARKLSQRRSAKIGRIA